MAAYEMCLTHFSLWVVPSTPLVGHERISEGCEMGVKININNHLFMETYVDCLTFMC